MSVGGHIIEKVAITLEGGTPAVRYMVMDKTHGDETVVFAEPSTYEPTLGDEIWWQDRTIYFHQDVGRLRKIGNSADAKEFRK